MVSVIIILVMLTVLLGTGAYAVISSAKTLQTNIEKLMTEDRLEEAAQGVLNNIISTTSLSTQTYNVPAPDNLAAPAVPSWISANAQTPRGVKFLYCPFSNISGSGSTITTPSGSYAVTVGTLYSGSENYITASAARPANASNALAIIVAPGPNQATAPDCQNITSGGTLAGAQVRIITEGEVQSRAQVIASAGAEYYAAPTMSGNNSGHDASNPIDLADLMIYVNQYSNQAVKIDLASGSYYLDLMNMTEFNSSLYSAVRNRSIYFSGSGSAGPTPTLFKSYASTTDNILILGNILFQNLAFPAVDNLLLKPTSNYLSTLIFDNSILQYANNSGGDGQMYFLGTNSYSGSDATSTTGNEITYNEYDALTYWGGTLTFPPSSFMNSSDLGKYYLYSRLVIAGGATLVSQGGANGSLMGYTGSVANIIDQGTIVQTAVSSGSAIFQLSEGSRIDLSGAMFNNMYTYALITSNSAVAVDRGTMLTYPSGITNQYPIYSVAGGEIAITNSVFGSTTTNSLRPAFTSIALNAGSNGWYSEPYELGGGTSGGWSSATLTGQSTTTCATPSNNISSYHLITDSGTTNGSSFLPLGDSTYEPLIILNRANWTCTHP